MCVQNLKSVALLDPEILGGTQKIWAVPGYVYAPSSEKFLMGFSSDASYECTCQIRSLALPVPELIGVPKNWGGP